MPTYCIKFERELEGIDVIHVVEHIKPNKIEAIIHIKEAGYNFNEGYDEIKEIFEV